MFTDATKAEAHVGISAWFHDGKKVGAKRRRSALSLAELALTAPGLVGALGIYFLSLLTVGSIALINDQTGPGIVAMALAAVSVFLAIALLRNITAGRFRHFPVERTPSPKPGRNLATKARSLQTPTSYRLWVLTASVALILLVEIID